MQVLPLPGGQSHIGHMGQMNQMARREPVYQTTGRRGDKYYTLQIEQQPDRARMCGFGDKDRRPITPPPCVRLIIRDATGADVDFNEMDSQHFILNVDLWNADATSEVNLVRHSNTSPSVSISMATTARYPPPPEPPQQHMTMMAGGPGQDQQYRPIPGHGDYYNSSAGYPYAGVTGGTMSPNVAGNNQSMFTRNLIGSVTVSASTLNDLTERSGFWFVLQDLSVRTEGSFRLKFSFIDLSSPQTGALNMGNCPVLATAFSDVFTVWSAKKFPGVKESTPLSKCFATQGVKIPIRKDGAKGAGKGDDYDADD